MLKVDLVVFIQLLLVDRAKRRRAKDFDWINMCEQRCGDARDLPRSRPMA